MDRPNLTLHGLKLSGHAHRVELLLELLELPYRYVETTAEGRASPAFLAVSPLGQVPVLQDGELSLADSNAIMVYLVRRYAPGSDWLPADPLGAAQVQRWFSIAAGELRFGPAAARAMKVFDRPGDPASASALAQKTFGLMEATLSHGCAFLVGGRPTLADLACYAYTAHAPEGGLSLQPYPFVRQWLARIEALPRFRPMTWTIRSPEQRP